MICPHCKVGINKDFQYAAIRTYLLRKSSSVRWIALHQVCPECNDIIIWLGAGEPTATSGVGLLSSSIKQFLVYPSGATRACPEEVPADLKRDFAEAVAVLSLSPQASAALSRKTLQAILRDYGKATGRDLATQIDSIIQGGHIPSPLAEQLDAVRHIGNFAAHPQKNINTGEIIPVEPNEAAWNLDVLEDLFDLYLVKPAIALKRKEALNKNLADAGKPTLP
jgi:hypothetical protein